MKKGTKYFYIFTMILLSCNAHKVLNPSDWISYLENVENDYRKVITVGDLVYSFQFKPSGYIALQEHLKDNSITQRIKELEYTVWFNIYLKGKESNINPLKAGISGLEEYNSRLSYFLASAEHNFSLIYGNSESTIAGYFFETNYGLTPTDVIVIGFKIPDAIPKEDIILAYEDKLFNSGILKIKITKEDLMEMPTLKL